jgi:hypothetical protein
MLGQADGTSLKWVHESQTDLRNKESQEQFCIETSKILKT